MNGEGDSPEVTGSESQAGVGRMWGLLQDLLEAHGREGTAALLGVNERTLRRAESNRHVTPQLQKELERYAGQGETPSPEQLLLELAALTSRFDGLKQGTQDTLDGLRRDMAQVVAENEALKSRVDELEQRSTGGVGQSTTEGGGGNPTPVSSTLAERPALDRRFPQLVTEEAEAGEHAVYGMAMPLITEWRERRRAYLAHLAHLDSANDWSRLMSELRMTELEIELIDAHVLTLPPADVPWDGIRRHSELRLRRRTLERLRRERRRARVKRWLLRLLTLGWRGR
ncbi:MAG: hypothetical protein OXH13_04385 [Chloroflexi bacterium]|nr:hypothetical protein [Chloroflexota bacterium]MCY3696050.1 hypothetical protein [Chloroflexota bacterium]